MFKKINLITTSSVLQGTIKPLFGKYKPEFQVLKSIPENIELCEKELFIIDLDTIKNGFDSIIYTGNFTVGISMNKANELSSALTMFLQKPLNAQKVETICEKFSGFNWQANNSNTKTLKEEKDDISKEEPAIIEEIVEDDFVFGSNKETIDEVSDEIILDEDLLISLDGENDEEIVDDDFVDDNFEEEVKFEAEVNKPLYEKDKAKTVEKTVDNNKKDNKQNDSVQVTIQVQDKEKNPTKILNNTATENDNNIEARIERIKQMIKEKNKRNDKEESLDKLEAKIGVKKVDEVSVIDTHFPKERAVIYFKRDKALFEYRLRKLREKRLTATEISMKMKELEKMDIRVHEKMLSAREQTLKNPNLPDDVAVKIASFRRQLIKAKVEEKQEPQNDIQDIQKKNEESAAVKAELNNIEKLRLEKMKNKTAIELLKINQQKNQIQNSSTQNLNITDNNNYNEDSKADSENTSGKLPKMDLLSLHRSKIKNLSNQNLQKKVDVEVKPPRYLAKEDARNDDKKGKGGILGLFRKK